ncbi:MAG: carboxylating nicotinate-nucleotide diphosphorylase [Actinobacteria bacterium]|nr:carboxylating nicotinate-nucleotide diphosphorylase [Actinomycetota bacterium]
MSILDKIEKYEILDLIRISIEEDLCGYGDVTTKFLISPENRSGAYIICKEKEGAVLSGIDVIGYILEEICTEVDYKKLKEDSSKINEFDIICTIYGKTQELLAAERICLNFLQHMTGIATCTHKFVEIASEYNVKVADTRKTKPGLRKLEKYAVFCGGGFNHRFGLFDGILIKDNHVIAAGGVKNAVEAIRNRIPHQLKIEVEVRDLNELDEAIESRVDIIMLDNMDIETIKASVKKIRQTLSDSCLIEVSGGITLNNLKEICKTGIDIISAGAITHSALSADFSLEFKE